MSEEVTLLSNALAQMNPPLGPAGIGTGWQITTVTDDGGTKHAFAVLSVSDGNGIHLYWFPIEQMKAFAEQTMHTFQIQTMEHRKLNPLLVASSAEADQIARNGFGSKRGEVNWPPENWSK